jgi:LCP family protein required for cell wall assembly
VTQGEHLPLELDIHAPTAGPPPWGQSARRAAAGQPAARHRRAAATPRLLRRYVAAGVASALVSTLGVAGCEYHSLDANITSLPLFGGIGGNAGTEKADRFGNTPIDVLVIGSDTRSSAADCALGKGCSTGGAGGTAANADVELLVHVAADRSNATVLSIPRDTVSDLPGCQDPVTGRSSTPRRAQINSSLAYGPGCTVAAVHALTGIPIGHFALLDFSAVVTMSDAVGGVPVCVSDDVYDTYSHLRLRRGNHVLKGTSALQFVRSRHGFGDGSDIGRTYAQHLFLGSMIRTVKSAGTIADPRRLLAVADAATKALTVDKGLGSIPDLLGLATDLGKVPSNRITFVTMPTAPDPSDPNRVVPASSAAAIFATVAADRPLPRSRSHGTPSPSPSATTPLGSLDGLRVRVQNATGRAGRAAEVAGGLRQAGLAAVTTATGTIQPTSSVSYPSGEEAPAQALAGRLGLPASAVVPSNTGGPLTVVVGLDWLQGTRFPGASPPPVDQSALDGGHATTADQAKDCAQVSRARTVELNGIPMTPSEAYRRAATAPDSAP